MKRLFASHLGSARAPRADCGASPQSSDCKDEGENSVSEKFAMAKAPSPAREARALPRISQQFIVNVVMLSLLITFISCETSNYIPPVTPQMSASLHGKRGADFLTLDRGRTLFAHRCIECHTLPPMWKYSRQDWPQIVNDMSHRASLKPDEREAIIAYILAVRATEPSPH